MTTTATAPDALDEYADTLARWAAQDAAYAETEATFRPESRPFAPYINGKRATSFADLVVDTAFAEAYAVTLTAHGL